MHCLALWSILEEKVSRDLHVQQVGMNCTGCFKLLLHFQFSQTKNSSSADSFLLGRLCFCSCLSGEGQTAFPTRMNADLL